MGGRGEDDGRWGRWGRELDVLAPVLAGELSDHAAECPPCAEFLAAHRAGVPSLMPAHVRDRLAGVLARLLDRGGPGGALHPDAAGPRPTA